MPLTQERHQATITTAQRHEKDSGSPEVQVSILTERIKDVSDHLKGHKHDFSSRRGLTRMVARRNSLLKYLSSNEPEKYHSLIQRLGLRK